MKYINENGLSLELSPFSMYWLEKCEEELPNEITAEKQSANHGETFISNSLGARRITLKGSIDTLTNLDAHCRNIQKVFNPTLKGTLVYSSSSNTDKEIVCHVEETPIPFWSGKKLLFEVELIAHTPFWKDREKTEYIALLQKALKFPLVIPTSKMYFGVRKSILETEVQNIGDVESGFRAIFKARSGSVTNPKIFNKITGEYIEIDYAMQKGDIIEVINYPELKKITINGIENGFRYLHIDSTFFNLLVGKNLIGYIAQENTINLDVVVYYTPRFLGV